LLVDTYERLGYSAAERTFAADLDTSFAHATATVPDLRPWKGLGPNAMAAYQNQTNRLRFRRTLDFVRPGDRVLDIGLGRGYLCGVLLRDGGIAAYHGVDIVAKNVEATRQMVIANGLTSAEVDVSVGDLFELTPHRVAATKADLVICCEVLEHVPDPERALRILADTLPDGAELLISVPMFGRLEGVWGHVTIFDVSRVRSMIKAAGLQVHHVEPLANTWAMILLSRSAEASERARMAAARRPEQTFAPLLTHRDWVLVDPATAAPVQRPAIAQLDVKKSGITCHVEATSPKRVFSAAQYGGLTIPVRAMHGLRLELGMLGLTKAKRLYVDGYAEGVRVGRWTWRRPRERDGRPKRTFVLRAGQSSGRFRARGFRDVSEVDHVEIVVKLAAGAATSLDLHRAAYLQ
jgi:2-polyprenyl-3-methyl-5-hydroxy-6-metoxy-1,4-benzoquinol methylase